jgi:hypothetical protein
MEELQDKAGKFLSEMRLKLFRHEQYKDQVPSDTTGKSYQLQVRWNDDVIEVSIDVPCSDLDCTDQRFLHERDVDFSLDGKTIALFAKKNLCGRLIDAPQYRSVKRALTEFEARRAELEKNVDTLPYWRARRLGLR